MAALNWIAGKMRTLGQLNPNGTVMNFIKSGVRPLNNAIPKILQNGGDVISHWIDTEITTAQVLALNATPIELVPAPGAGKALIFDGAMLFLDYNAAAYAGVAAGENLQISYTDGSGLAVSVLETVGFIDQTNDETLWAMLNQANTLNEILPVVNAALVISLLVGEITTGDSPLKVRTYYRTVATIF